MSFLLFFFFLPLRFLQIRVVAIVHSGTFILTGDHSTFTLLTRLEVEGRKQSLAVTMTFPKPNHTETN